MRVFIKATQNPAPRINAKLRPSKMKWYFHHKDKLVSSQDDYLSQLEVLLYLLRELGLIPHVMVHSSRKRKQP